MRRPGQLGGAFGVAILAGVFAGAGSYASAAAFSSGFVPATAAASGLALAGALAAVAVPGRPKRAHVTSTESASALQQTQLAGDSST